MNNNHFITNQEYPEDHRPPINTFPTCKRCHKHVDNKVDRLLNGLCEHCRERRKKNI